MNYKKISHISLVASLTLVFVFPLISLAVGNAPSQEAKDAKKTEIQDARDAKKEEIQENRLEKTCEMLISQAQKIQNRFSERITKLTQARTEAQAKIQERVETRANERTTKQTSWEEKKELNWTKLEEKAQTDKQKIAIAKFTETLQNAVKVKNDAIDKIITELRAQIQTRNNERKSQIDSDIEIYQDTISSIITQLTSDCSAGKDIKEIRDSYRNEMKQARETFQNRERVTQEFRTELETLKNTKKSEVQSILETFKQTIEDAKIELRTAFPATTE
jgi:ElaB/YqjD/DUF883 family membrane-anchored ribosome-binding protein